MTGHIRSIVPQKGGVSPIDNNTVFYAPFDEHPNDVLQGIKMVGNKHSMKFDTGRIDCGSSSAFNVTTGITIESWVYFTESNTKEMFVKTTGSYEFFQSGQTVTFRTTGNTLGSVGLIPLNTWTHIAATFNGATKCIYINGVLDASVAHTTPISVNTNSFVIGAYADGTYQYKGRFSDTRLWNIALSLNEIKKYMNEPPKQDGLVGWWKLDENDVTVAYDYSSNGNDGLIVGSNSLVEGRAIYSLVKGGYPGGIIKPQEATENMLPTVDLTNTSKWTNRTCTVTQTTEVTSPNGYQVFKAIPTAGDAAITWAASMSSFPAGTYTMSAWMRAPDGQQYTLGWSTGHTASSTNPIVVTDQWKRFTLTQTGTAAPSTYLHLVGGYSTWSTGENIYISEPQVEVKPYATEFTASKRSARQEYGGGVLVEEGTTNYITNPLGGYVSPWGSWDPSTVQNIPNQIVEGRNCTIIKVGIRTNGANNHNAIHRSTPTSNGSSNTLSFYAKLADESDIATGVIDVYINTYVPYTINKTEWTRIALTQTATATAETIHINNKTGKSVLIALPQLEQKLLATSFADGVREKGFLAYANPLKSCTQFTISCWIKVLSDGSTTANGKQPILTIGNGPNLFWGRNLPSKSLGLFYGTAWKIDPGNLLLNVGEWYFVALVGSGTKVSMYYNGVFAGEANDFDMNIMANANLISMGCEAEYAEKRTINGNIDEVRIDKIARTAGEILAWYYQGRNGW